VTMQIGIDSFAAAYDDALRHRDVAAAAGLRPVAAPGTNPELENDTRTSRSMSRKDR